MIVTTNYGVGFPGVADGNMYEEFDRDWKRWMESTQEGELHLGFPSAWVTMAPSKVHSHYDHLDSENQRRNRFVMGAAALFGGFGTFGRYEGDKVWQKDRLDPSWHFAEWSHPQLGKGWLGAAVDPVPTSPSPINRFLWTRHFERGIVIVNTDQNQPHSVYLPARYRPIGGVVKDGWSIPARDALILEAV